MRSDICEEKKREETNMYIPSLCVSRVQWSTYASVQPTHSALTGRVLKSESVWDHQPKKKMISRKVEDA